METIDLEWLKCKEKMSEFDNPTVITFKSEVGFERLPDEMIDLITRDLDIKCKLNARFVCRKWNEIIKLHVVFRVKLDDKSLARIKSLGDDFKVEQLLVQNFLTKNSLSLSRSGLNKDVRYLILGAKAGTLSETQHNPITDVSEFKTNWKEKPMYQNVTYCSKKNGISKENLQSLLKMMASIEWWSVSSRAFCRLTTRDNSILRNLQFNNLTVLDINVFTNTKDASTKVSPYIAILKNFFPVLNTLLYANTSWKTPFPLIIALFQFIANHEKTLKKLKVTHSTVYHLTSSFEDPEKYKKLLEDIMKVKLSHLYYDTLKFGPHLGMFWKQFETKFLENQSCLENLQIHCSARYSIMLDYKKMFPLFQNTIRSVHINWNCIQQGPFDCSCLKDSRNLQTLYLDVRQINPACIYDPMLINLKCIPKSLTSLTLNGFFSTEIAEWISKNLLELREIAFLLLLHDELNQILDYLKIYLHLPKLKIFHIKNARSPRAAEYAYRTPGLSITPTNFNTLIHIDRSVFIHNAINDKLMISNT